MKKQVEDSLPELLKKHITTLRKTSLDETNGEYMSDSSVTVVNFDKIPNEYARGRGWTGVPNSNDALYIDDHKNLYFIEFKNGGVKKDQLYRKLYDSLIMLIDEKIIQNFSFVREHGYYILVYGSKYSNRIPDAPARRKNYDYIYNLAEMEQKLFGIDKFEGYLFRETHTYTKDLFKMKFAVPMEQKENENKT